MATKIYCSDISCKYNDLDTGRCKAKEASFSWQSVQTVYNGRQDYLKCATYEESDMSKEMHVFIERAMKEEPIP